MDDAGAAWEAPDRIEYEHNLAAARAQLSDEEWEKAWQEGQAMTMEEAIAYAFSEPNDD